MDEGMEHESTDDGWEDTQGRKSSIRALFYTGVYVFLKNLTPLFLYRGVCFPEKSPPPSFFIQGCIFS